MSERHFDVVLPEEVVAGFGWAEERYQRVREALVMELLRQLCHFARLPELLQLSRWDLSELMGTVLRFRPD